MCMHGAVGHKAFQCWKHRQGAGKESTQTRALNTLVAGLSSVMATKQAYFIALRQQLQDAEVDDTLT